ncbi:RagB/SusD family nutrient uptake outer membrane protein [uncultured Muribaculum sp.]|uniref:RagB/SusD family nutrient uptake outer membrane protein n=1 Tax=uncultured Muribaculum sp. TaxID=1918613 RepID=UPI0025951D33|nr:RagB/SusD family nutrient uptake outer membrane protein [uncultured Muribaculum sp.]
MKFLKYIVPSLMLSIGLSSCDDIFRDAPNDKLSPDVIWENEILLNGYVLPWYNGMDNGFSTLVTTLMAGLGSEYEPWYGDQLTVGKRSWYQTDYGNILKSQQSMMTTRGRTKWISAYTEISSINTLLENENKLVPDIRDRVLGEAHFFRAYFYYKLLRMYGGTLLIDHVFDPLKKAEKFPRASYEEMVRFIADEAEKASWLLPAKYNDDQAGRATRGAALMLKAKTFLWVAGAHFQNQEKSYLGFPDDRSMEMLDSAAANYDRVMALNVYDLVQIPAGDRQSIVDAYRNIFLTKNTIESILEVQHADDGDFHMANGHKLDRDAAPPSAGGTTAAYNPTQNHVDEYRMANGKRINEAGSGYDRNNPYDNRDVRFYANVLYDGAEWRGNIMDLHYETVDGAEVAGTDLTIYGSSNESGVTRTGYYMAKFLNQRQVIDNDQTYASSQNCILWRYAELLLDYAEIDFKKGRVNDALAKVNMIRERVHEPALTSVTWDDITNERRVELAFEKETYWDALRYNEAERRMTGTYNPLYGVKIVYDANGNKKITNPVVNGRNTSVRYFRARQYYYPIPWDDIRYHEIDQNPEWVEM